jgi:hypothetical protein
MGCELWGFSSVEGLDKGILLGFLRVGDGDFFVSAMSCEL